jgi:hypothetical protein
MRVLGAPPEEEAAATHSTAVMDTSAKYMEARPLLGRPAVPRGLHEKEEASQVTILRAEPVVPKSRLRAPLDMAAEAVQEPEAPRLGTALKLRPPSMVEDASAVASALKRASGAMGWQWA